MVSSSADGIWGRSITNLKQKQKAAANVASRLKKGDVVGIGSGSTSFITLKALVQRRDTERLDFQAIPTSIEMELVCAALSVPITTLIAAKPNWSFDGADEVDGRGNMIKGRGGAMLRERILMQACPEVYIVIDPSKRVKRLGQNFPVPVEIHPSAIHIVKRALAQLTGVTSVMLRQSTAKDGPVITENGNLILDVKFSKISDNMENRLKDLVGVVETGLFIGYKTRIITGN